VVGYLFGNRFFGYLHTTSMATSDREWPGYTQWYCCPRCHRLWTYQGKEKEMVALDLKFALGPASASEGTPPRLCIACEGDVSTPTVVI